MYCESSPVGLTLLAFAVPEMIVFDFLCVAQYVHGIPAYHVMQHTMPRDVSEWYSSCIPSVCCCSYVEMEKEVVT